MDKLKIIRAETEELLKKMIDQFEVEVKEESGVFHVVIKTGDEASTVIGRHGETIRSLQKILEVILYKKLSEGIDLLVNVNDYREKQQGRLEAIAQEVAKKVEKEKREAVLRSFSSYERKVIHEYISQNYPHLTSYSIGEGKDRRLVITLKQREQNEEKTTGEK